VPKNLELDLIDRVEQVTNEESVEMARRLTREEGILSGISCGAAAACVGCAWRSCRNLRAKPIVTVLPDSGERYISTILFEGLAKQPKPGSACRVGQGSSFSAPLSQHCAPKRIVNS